MSPFTTVVINDPALLAQLASTTGPIVFRGPDGACVRFANPAPLGQWPAGVRPPISDEEFEKLRQQPDGLPLDEVWKRIQQRYGS